MTAGRHETGYARVERNLHPTPPARNVAQRGDALGLLQSLPDACAALAFFDPQHRSVLDKLAFGNEGARQRERCKLLAMGEDYIDACCREIARVLVPSGYCMRWADTYGLCEAHHLRVADCLKCVDLIAWDNLRPGMGKRSRRRGDYLLVLQRPLLTKRKRRLVTPASNWRDHNILTAAVLTTKGDAIMMKQTEAYLAALAQLADVLTLQAPADVIAGLEHRHHEVWDGHVCVDLLRVLRERHLDFAQAMDQVREEREQRRQAEMTASRATNKDDMILF